MSKALTNEQIRKALAMSEAQFYEWLCCNNEPYKLGIPPFPLNTEEIKKSLADLAFRLRDEAIEDKGDMAWHKATLKICGYMRESSIWFKNYGQPIHWILAAMLAKGKEDGE